MKKVHKVYLKCGITTEMKVLIVQLRESGYYRISVC